MASDNIVLGGWMTPNPVEAAKAEAEQAQSSEKEFTLEELQKHNKEGDAWIVIENKGTLFLLSCSVTWSLTYVCF